MQLKNNQYSKAQDLTKNQQDKKHNNINPLVMLEHFNFNIALIKDFNISGSAEGKMDGKHKTWEIEALISRIGGPRRKEDR